MGHSPGHTSKTPRVIGVIGLGQIGGALCAALRVRSDSRLLGFDIDPALTREAHARGIIHDPASSAKELMGNADTVILATPMTATIEILQTYPDLLRPLRLVTDTGSLKEAVMIEATRLNLTNFVGGHPLAGSELRAPDAWKRDLFEDISYLYCPAPAVSATALAAFHDLTACLRARPVEIEPTRHDRLFALTSGLPHAVAVTLARLFEAETADQKDTLVGPSFRSATRVARSNPDLIRHLLFDNRINVAAQLDIFIAFLTQLRDSLRNNDPEGLDHLLKD